ncbi:MAG: phosphoadenylyl-sulfate reductase [Deltaproteobacteria bacterium]|nr:phosphoadenylyl-sulfate reductase [Deltaproteobacteria bacterium]
MKYKSKVKSASSPMPQIDIDSLNSDFEDKSPRELLKWALDELHPSIALAWSGAEDVALVDMMLKINPQARVFTLDTGRLNEETYQLISRVREKYGMNVEVLFPHTEQTEEMIRQNGINLFYDSIEKRKLCCKIRKVQPLTKMLSTMNAWITGLRRDQSVTRTVLQKIEIDHAFGGIIKINPLAGWSHDDVWRYIRENDVPFNELHEKGYPSIGCAPCTRAVQEGEDIRAGRWWWEEPESKECGLHIKSK